MILGVTGTQNGLTDAQWQFAVDFFKKHQPKEVHHGCCIGADAQIHGLALQFKCHIVIHPPINPKKMAPISIHQATWVNPKEYLERNRDIVHESEYMLAFPFAEERTLPRSGTWYTVRYTMKQNKPISIVWSDGHTHDFGRVSEE